MNDNPCNFVLFVLKQFKIFTRIGLYFIDLKMEEELLVEEMKIERVRNTEEERKRKRRGMGKGKREWGD